MITQEELIKILSYDLITGIFTWIKPAGSRFKCGDKAGSLKNNGYMMIQINGISYVSHRLAWFYVHGKWPDDQIDHINGIRDDNRICNLREATKSQNLVNRTIKTNRCLARGVWRVSRKNIGDRYVARATVNGKRIHLGTFENSTDAHTVYCNFMRNTFGEYFNL